MISSKQNFRSPNTLMVQGTTSDAGKSVLVAGLCRLLLRQEQSVAPFKPQNMALNSAVTVNGGEIGRAQAVQAQACRLEPHTDMNPVLLKPSSDIGAQVIIQGHAVNTMLATEFHDYKKVAMGAVMESFDRLSQSYDHVIVEGAGSPAEINLRSNDIANMGFAEAVDCPVIIVADIDRGGVFAHLVGTLELLSKNEQHRVIGFVINRFRGDISLLESGLKWLENKTGKPVLGVLPYLTDFYLDAEDSINIQQQLDVNNDQTLKVVVPAFPRISNHTDFDALRLHPQVDLEFVRPGQKLPAADLIILPGSKNVRADMAALVEHQWDQDIRKHLRYGGKVLGICGGYQMLGTDINDPLGIEDHPGGSPGLGLLNLQTELQTKKHLVQQSGTLNLPNGETAGFSGYEIHCGISTGPATDTPWLRCDSGLTDGSCSADQQVLGTYMHGLFDQSSACNALLKWAGLKTFNSINLPDLREQQLERLADCLQEHLDSDFQQWLVKKPLTPTS